jgi:hypothetical protein
MPSARRHGVFGYPKQSATVSVGSVLKRRARPRKHGEGELSTSVDEQHNRQQMISLGLTCDQVKINFPVGMVA